MTARDHCPTCGHRHQRGPTGRLACGGDDGTCKCDPADPCRCGVCEMARASRGETDRIETITCSRAYYMTDGCRCDACGRRWMEIPPAGGEFVRWVQGAYVAAKCERCAKLRPVASLDIDARERTLADERETSARVEVARIGERKPSAGWVEGDGGWWRLGDDAAVLSAIVRRRTDGKFSWGACSPGVMFLSGRSGTAKTADAAQLAAEDTLLAIAAEIVGAVGR